MNKQSIALLTEAKIHLDVSKRLLTLGDNLSNNKIFSKILKELTKSLLKIIEVSSIIKKSNEKDKNLFFFKKIAPKWISEENRRNLIGLLILTRKCNLSSLEFSRKNNLVLFSEGKFIHISKDKIIDFIHSLEHLMYHFSTKKA